MSKDKKQKPKEESVKLDMSFEDAIRLAVKTPPSYTIRLNVDEQIELKEVSGRIIELISISSPDLTSDLGNFQIETDIKADETPGFLRHKPFIAMTYLNARLQNMAYFKIRGMDSRIVLNNKERLFLTLKSPAGKQIPGNSCELTYLKHTKF